MCGINGFYNIDGNIQLMNDALAHRGPDGEGAAETNNVTLGHRRLSIIDITDAGHQPMGYSKIQGASSASLNKEVFETTTLRITYNGEIYNYLELRKELQEVGYAFDTETDTEVLLAAYLHWGESCVQKFNGMWAFCIHDLEQQKLFCSRDRLGQKPFYYYWQNNQFVFSSELVGLQTILEEDEISSDGLNLYLSLGFIPSPHTIFKKISKLPAGHNLSLDLKRHSIEISRYYVPSEFKASKTSLSEINKLFSDAVSLRMRSDVPVGAFLSGGLDSTSVTSKMKNHTSSEKLNTFSIGFDGVYDESDFIKSAHEHLKTNHHHNYFTQKDFDDMISETVRTYGEPYASPSAFPMIMLSEKARAQVTVSLSGDGGDEIFGGYTSHKAGYLLDILEKTPRTFRVLVSKIPISQVSKLASLSLAPAGEYRTLLQKNDGYAPEIFDSWVYESMELCKTISGSSRSELNRLFDLLFFTLPDDFLTKVDRASMSKSLEVRSPFLDHRLVALAQRLNTKDKVGVGRKQKKALQKIMRGHIPDQIINRKKQGFTPPIEQWIMQESYDEDVQKGLSFIQKLVPEFMQQWNETLKKDSRYRLRVFMLSRWATHQGIT